MTKSVLLINDMPGHGRVAMSAMIPIMSKMNITVYNLPTALISNTLNYGKYELLDTTEYMEKTLKIWGELDFQHDAIGTGLIFNEKQAALVASYCKEQAKKGVFIMCDPIMADNGKLYNSMTSHTVEYIKKIVAVADFVVPNITEAMLLSGLEYKENLLKEEVVSIIEKIRKIGAKSVIVTSCKINGKSMVVGYDKAKDNYFFIEYKKVEGVYYGTGDMFSAVMLGELLSGKSLEDCVKSAINYVLEAIETNRANHY